MSSFPAKKPIRLPTALYSLSETKDLAQAAAGEGATGLRSAAPDAPVFSARLYGAPFALIASVPNPIVTACYKATPEYTYLYTPAGMVGAPPAEPHRHGLLQGDARVHLSLHASRHPRHAPAHLRRRHPLPIRASRS